LRQPDLGQRARKPDPCSNPKLNATTQGARAVRPGRPLKPDALGGDKYDAERDGRLHRRAGHRHPSERCGDQRDAVREGRAVIVRRIRLPPRTMQQGQDEQQVIDATRMLDASANRKSQPPNSGRRLDDELRPLWQQVLDLARSIQTFDTDDDVGDATGDAVDGHRLPCEPAGAVNRPALDERTVANLSPAP
jgi:hypothetical protein